MESLWNVRLTPHAKRQFRQLDGDVKLEASEALGELQEEPFPFDVIPMEGYTDLYRVRFYGNQYRIVYQVLQRNRKIVVVSIGPRGTVYAKFKKPRP